MRKYILTRLAQMLPVIVVASFLIFMITRWIPGDPAAIYAGPNASASTIAAVSRTFGLNKPLPEQYILWVGNALKGNFGASYISQLPATELVGNAVLNTVELALSAIIFAVVVGTALGIVAGLRRGRPTERIVSAYNAICLSVPNFWLGFMLLLLFAVNARILPPGGHTNFGTSPVGWIEALVLPTVALGARFSAVVSRFVRSATIEVLGEDFIRTSYAKGLSTLQVVRHDILKNVSLQIITITGVEFGGLLAGAVVIETVFSWPGLGRLMIQSVDNRDYAVLQLLLLIFVLAFLITSVLADICQSFVDPRIRVGRGSE